VARNRDSPACKIRHSSPLPAISLAFFGASIFRHLGRNRSSLLRPCNKPVTENQGIRLVSANRMKYRLPLHPQRKFHSFQCFNTDCGCVCTSICGTGKFEGAAIYPVAARIGARPVVMRLSTNSETGFQMGCSVCSSVVSPSV
jgi:hypothetical protein